MHSALREQRVICRALEERLSTLEEGAAPTLSHGEALTGELEERVEECNSLRVQVEEVRN